MPKRLLPWMALCACSPLLAAPTVPEARLQQLAADPYWIALGHYERGKLGGWRSYVDDERFFLADNGESHPDAELAATLKALYASPSLGDKHAQCVYPARTRWLRQQLQLDDLPQPQCGEYDNWYRDINPHSAVLVFPAAYLNSPSSMFGHTLLRIDQADVTSNNTALLSYALNFGAYIEGMDNSILYAWKGLMGGYPGLFALVPYREKLAEYSRLENRDLWEYKLNLTPEETGRMVEHVWELKQVRFDYYFFDENCSFRLLELMEIARPGIELTEQFPLTAIPTDTVRAVKNAGLIERIDYRPSREKELLARAEPLDHAERDWAKRLADDDSLLDAPDFKALPMPRQALIQDAAFRLVRYRATGQARDSGIASRSYNLLRAINRNPPPDLQVERPGQPEDGHESRTWQFGVGSRDDRAFAEYGLRMAYHDLADNAYGFPPRRADRDRPAQAAPVRRQPLAVAESRPGHHPLADPAQPVAQAAVLAGRRRPGAGAGRGRRRKPGQPSERRRRRQLDVRRRPAALRHGHRADREQQGLRRRHRPGGGLRQRPAVAQPAGQPDPGGQGRLLPQR